MNPVTYGYIYKITNPKGKIYIGKTVRIEQRFKVYKYGLCNRQPLIYNSIKKYGWPNHKFEIIFKSSNIENLERYEEIFIKYYNSFNSQYSLNLSPGGQYNKHSHKTTKRKKVFVYTVEGKFFKEFDSLTTTCMELKISGAAAINKIMDSTTHSAYNKYIFRSTFSGDQIAPLDRKNYFKVYQFDLNGNYLATYRSIYQASNLTGAPREGISKMCKGLKNYKTAGGYLWSFNDYIIIPKNKNKKEIKVYNSENTYVFHTVIEASKFLKVNSDSFKATMERNNFIYKGYNVEYL